MNQVVTPMEISTTQKDEAMLMQAKPSSLKKTKVKRSRSIKHSSSPHYLSQTTSSASKKIEAGATTKTAGKKSCPISENIHEPTCSSALKSSSSSNDKVCRYSYCSLHGHRHANVPPVKRFVSMRRRVLKTQMSRRKKSSLQVGRDPVSSTDQDECSRDAVMRVHQAFDNILAQIPSEEEKSESKDQQMPKNWSRLKKIILLKRFVSALENVRDLKPQHLPPPLEKSRSEGWMLDYALQQVISRLRPSEKRKVGLIAHAFEIVIPGTALKILLSESDRQLTCAPANQITYEGSSPKDIENLSTETIQVEVSVDKKQVQIDHEKELSDGKPQDTIGTSDAEVIKTMDSLQDIETLSTETTPVEVFVDEKQIYKRDKEISDMKPQDTVGISDAEVTEAMDSLKDTDNLSAETIQVEVFEDEKQIHKHEKEIGDVKPQDIIGTSDAEVIEAMDSLKDTENLSTETIQVEAFVDEKQIHKHEKEIGDAKPQDIIGSSDAEVTEAMDSLKDIQNLSIEIIQVEDFVDEKQIHKRKKKITDAKPQDIIGTSDAEVTEAMESLKDTENLSTETIQVEAFVDEKQIHKREKEITDLKPQDIIGTSDAKVTEAMDSLEHTENLSTETIQVEAFVDDKQIQKREREISDVKPHDIIGTSDAEVTEAMNSEEDYKLSRDGILTETEDHKSSRLWQLIYKHMVTDVEAEPETPQGEDIGKRLLDCEDKTSEAVKLVRQAFDKILSEIPSDDQSISSDTTSVQDNNEKEMENDTTSGKDKAELNAGKQMPSKWSNLKKMILVNRFVNTLDHLRSFKPRKPNFLPLEPDPEAENINLRHQSIEERKRAEEWMLDYALRKVISTMAPSQKRKVTLLVKAFETVNPLQDNGTNSKSYSPLRNEAKIGKENIPNPETRLRESLSQFYSGTQATVSTEKEVPDFSNDKVNGAQGQSLVSKVGWKEEATQFEEHESQPKEDMVNEIKSEKQQYVKLWCLLHKHMASSDFQENDKLTVNKNGSESSNTNIETEDTLLGQMEAIKFVEQAIDEIPIHDVEESKTSDTILDQDSSFEQKPKAQMHRWSNVKKLILLKRFVKGLEKVKPIRKASYIPNNHDKEEAEKVSKLRHREDRKHDDDWMLDNALQQVVAKLTPARKRKVALLVEAFESVIPTI